MNKILLIFILLMMCISCNGAPVNKYAKYINSSKEHIKKHHLSTRYMVIIDYSIFSGKERMFVYDFKKKKIVDSFLVMHGNPPGKRTSKVVFSNSPKSFLSSQGKYIIKGGITRSNNFIVKYNLIGLDKTNSNAVKRKIVIHYSKHVPLMETKQPIVNSRGCPAISWYSFIKLSRYLSEDTLLWVI